MRNGKMRRKNRNNRRKRKSTIDSYRMYVFDDFCSASLCERFGGKIDRVVRNACERSKEKKKNGKRAIITATLLSSHRINIIRCIV